jgi:competence protein ComEA
MEFMRMKAIGLGGCAAVLLLAPAMLISADNDEAKLLPDGPGKELVVRMCFECHGAGNFRKSRLSRDGWSEQVSDMVDRGAKGTEAELAKVVDYLVLNFGKDSKININTAPFGEIKNVLGLSAKDCQAVIDYREANGNFKNVDDLKKVPGIDGQKIDAKKSIIVL